MKESALKERRSLAKKLKRASLGKGEPSSVSGATAGSCTKQQDQDSPKTEKVGFFSFPLVEFLSYFLDQWVIDMPDL